MRKILFLFCSFSFFIAQAQTSITEEAQRIVAEGKKLYRLEMCSWIGTDIFLQLGDKEKRGSYFSYFEGDKTRCIYYSKGDNPKVIGSILLDSTYKSSKAETDFTERAFTPQEKEIFDLKAAVVKAVVSDTFFKHYSNTGTNLVFLIENGEKKVYILTAAEESGVMLFGNDYLLTFDNSNKLLSKEKFHNSMIPTDYNKYIDAKESMHTHVVGRGVLISPTDICTLMLNEKYTKWEQYSVISSKYVSIWNCKKNELHVITTDEWVQSAKEKDKK